MGLLKICSESEGFLDEILSCIQNVIVLADIEGRILYSSLVAEEVLGFAPVELKGQNLSVIFSPEDLSNLYPNLLYMASKNRSFRGELMLKRKDGTPFFAFVVLRTHIDSSKGKPLMVVCIQDIDKMKRLERTMSETPHEDLIKVANGIAHELRNPLVVIGGFLNKLYESCAAVPDRDRCYEHISNGLRRIENLVEKVEFFAHLPAPDLKQESIKALVEKALQPYLEQIEERQIELTVSVEDLSLFVDPDLVVRAISVIIENALDALSGGDKKIVVSSEVGDNQCKLYLKDTGSGISEEDLPYIFNPFFSTKADGAGIDLALVKRILDGHRGEIELTSKQGQGTTFVFLFPLERRRPIRAQRLEGQKQ